MIKIGYDLISSFNERAETLWGPHGRFLMDMWTWDLRTFPELAEAALLIAQSPNLSHLKFGATFEMQHSFLGLIGLDSTAPEDESPTQAFHGFPKLKRITLLILGYDLGNWTITGNNVIDERRKQALHELPVAPEIFITGNIYEHISHVSMSKYFPKTHALTFYDTNAGEDELIQIIEGFSSLTHFQARLSIMNYRLWTELDMFIILQSLAAFKDTLQHLCLNALLAGDLDLLPHHSFADFTSLTTLVIPQVIFFGTLADTGADVYHWVDEMLPVPISEMLPPTLQKLHLVDMMKMCMSNKSRIWWVFGDHLGQGRLPRLNHVIAEGGEGLYCGDNDAHDVDDCDPFYAWWHELIHYFAESGVKLEVTTCDEKMERLLRNTT